MMEESSKLTEKCKNVTASEFPELKCSPSDDSCKGRMYSSEERNTSSQTDTETLNPESTDILKKSKLSDSSNVSKLSDSSNVSKLSDSSNVSKLSDSSNLSNFSESIKDRTVLMSSQYSDSAMSEIDNRTDDSMKLVAKHETALRGFSSSDTRTSHKTSNESPKKTKLSKSKKFTKKSRRDAKGSSKTKVCNLQTLISNEDTRDIGLFYSALAELDIGSSNSGKTNFEISRLSHAESSKNIKSSEIDKKSKSSDLDRKSKSSEVHKKSKSSKVHKKSKSSEVHRKSMSSEIDKMSKSSEIDRKSKVPMLNRKSNSSKSLTDTRTSEAPIMSELVRSLQEMKLPETNVTDKAIISEGASASIESKNQDLSGCSENKIELYFNLFRQNKSSSSSREGSDSGTLTPGSDELDSRTSLESCKSLKKLKPDQLQTTTSNLSTQSSKSNMRETSSKSKFTENSMGYELSEKSKKSKLPKPSGTLQLPDSSVRSKASDSYVQSKASDSYVQSKSSDSSVQSKSSDSSIQSKSSDSSVQSKSCDSSVRTKSCDSSAQSKSSDSSVQSKLSDPPEISKLSDLSEISKLSEPSVRSKLSDLSETSKLSDLSETSKLSEPSVRSKLSDPSVRSKLSDPSVKSKLSDPSVRSKLSDPSAKLDGSYEKSDGGAVDLTESNEPNFQHYMTDLRLKQYVISRRPYFLDLQANAERVKAFMNQVAKLRQDYRHDIKITESRRMKADASDWFKLIYYWDLVKAEMNMLIETIAVLYESDKNVLMTNKEFHDFMLIHILCIFEDILDLICLCQNGLIKYTKLCSSHDMYLFLKHVIVFESHVRSLFNKIRIESEQFTTFKKNESN